MKINKKSGLLLLGLLPLLTSCPPSYGGPLFEIQEFADSSIKYKLRMHANPEMIPQLKRDIRVIIKKEFDKHNIEIPFMQVDIHSK